MADRRKRLPRLVGSGVLGGKNFESWITGLSPVQWLDETTALYQDTAGTTPAVAVSDPIGRWNDRSGNGYNVLQATADLRPSLKASALNNKRGSASSNASFAQSLSVAINGTAWTGFTAILVVKPTAADAFKGMWTFSNAPASGTPLLLLSRQTANAALYFDGGYRHVHAVANNVTKAYIVTADGTTWRVWINGVQQAPYTAGLTNLASAQNVYLHTGFNPSSNSDIMEIVLFNKALTVDQVTQIAPALNRKWGLS